MAVSTLTFAACTAVYLVIVLYLGFLGYRQTKGTEDYMLAGRKVTLHSSHYPMERLL